MCSDGAARQGKGMVWGRVIKEKLSPSWDTWQSIVNACEIG